MQLQVFDCEQGSADWFRVRAGIPTASCFNDILTKGRGGEPSKTRRTYMLKLAGERLTGIPMEAFSTIHMQRGHEMEEEARRAYSMITDLDTKPIGFIRRGDTGASPDSLVGDDGMLELKTKLPHLQIDLLLSDETPKEHYAQCQGQLWIAEREWVDLGSYWPGLPMFVKRIYRDEPFIEKLKSAVDEFNQQLSEVVERIQKYERHAP